MLGTYALSFVTLIDDVCIEFFLSLGISMDERFDHQSTWIWILFLKKKCKMPDVLSSNVHNTYFSKLNAFEPVMTLRIQNNDKFKDIY